MKKMKKIKTGKQKNKKLKKLKGVYYYLCIYVSILILFYSHGMAMAEAKIGSLLIEERNRFRRRFLLLDGSSLYCFAHPPEMTPQTRLVVQTGVLLQALEHDNAILVTEIDSRTVFKFTADSAAEAADWTHALELAVRGQEGAVLKMGFLTREVLGKWGTGRVWAVLDQGVLFTFRRPPEFSPTAVLPLDRTLQMTKSDVEPDGSAPFELQASYLKGSKPPVLWRLKAEDEVTRDEWMDAITCRAEAYSLHTEDSHNNRLCKRGWLLKLSGGIGDTGWLATFRPRYVSIGDGSLRYYARPSDSVARGGFSLFEDGKGAIL